MRLWRKRYGTKTNIYSDTQLGDILFKQMGFAATAETKRGWKTDEEALKTIDHPFVTDYLEAKKYKKAATTYLRGIARETVNGMLHCFFNLHTTQTYRSSSEAVNFQNQPKQ